MARRLQLESLEAEHAAVSRLLEQSLQAADRIGAKQFAQRRQHLEDEMQSARSVDSRHASIAILFGGKPVYGSRGIAADFAGQTLRHFQDLVSKQFAAAEFGVLGARGKVPAKADTSLMVTEVMHGSFGFHLRELSDQSQVFDTELKEIVRKVVSIIGAAGGDDELAFEAAAEELDSRTLVALRDFFIGLESHGATVRLVDDDRDLRLDEASVSRARCRTEDTQIEEQDDTRSGVLIGFLPEHRRFELEIGAGETIYGSATVEAAEQFRNAMQNRRPPIGQQCSVKLKERTVTPRNRPPRQVHRLLEFLAFGEGST